MTTQLWSYFSIKLIEALSIYSVEPSFKASSGSSQMLCFEDTVFKNKTFESHTTYFHTKAQMRRKISLKSESIES